MFRCKGEVGREEEREEAVEGEGRLEGEGLLEEEEWLGGEEPGGDWGCGWIVGWMD